MDAGMIWMGEVVEYWSSKISLGEGGQNFGPLKFPCGGEGIPNFGHLKFPWGEGGRSVVVGGRGWGEGGGLNFAGKKSPDQGVGLIFIHWYS